MKCLPCVLQCCITCTKEGRTGYDNSVFENLAMRFVLMMHLPRFFAIITRPKSVGSGYITRSVRAMTSGHSAKPSGPRAQDHAQGTPGPRYAVALLGYTIPKLRLQCHHETPHAVTINPYGWRLPAPFSSLQNKLRGQDTPWR